mmetsp:Transcript_66075/g.154682  ORF Transcript_66075/g.154682 Transcript_66075/m.154682 type:complete len:622 (+) Transcript_66075:24-1889(+)
MDALSPPPLDRTPSAHSRYTTAAAWCFERHFEGQELRPPVRVVVFDCDETLTLSTFLPDDAALRTQLDWTSPWEEYIATVNFESPFATSGRLALLREMLEDLRRGTRKLPGRLLAVLTRNTNGPVACLNLLRAAKLADLFDAVWCMSHVPGIPAGLYRAGTDWLAFEPPLASLPDHKAHVIHNIAEQPSAWFPQKTDGSLMSMLPDPLRPQEIMLVDDVRTNFQCGGSDPKKVYRCCKVARYDAPNFRDMGLVRDMGGIGAHNEEDYKTVVDFAKRPWAYKVDWRVHCIEKPFDGAALQPPVQLVIFDFDGALTLYTFMPEDPRCSTEVGYAPESVKRRYVEYNFESPYLEGSRVQQLQNLLESLESDPETGERRVLAILTINEAGAIAVLNILMMADLAKHFSAVWTLSARVGQPGGVYRIGHAWRTFTLPVREADGRHKSSVLQSLLSCPSGWFPQISGGSGEESIEEKLLSGLSLENIVWVDDARSPSLLLEDDEEYEALRHCRVASYDDEYRDQGLLWHMGGLGARSAEDYGTLLSFVRAPWHFAGQHLTQMSSRPSFGFGAMDTPREDNPIPLQRSKTEQDLAQRVPCKKREAEAAGLSDGCDGVADVIAKSSTIV